MDHFPRSPLSVIHLPDSLAQNISSFVSQTANQLGSTVDQYDPPEGVLVSRACVSPQIDEFFVI